jgi:hypothetical protein
LLQGFDSGRSIGGAFGQVCSDFTYDKDSDDVYDHLLELVLQATFAINWGVKTMMDNVLNGRLKAHAKHGDNSIEAKAGDETLFWLSCLGEEYGELCDEAADFPRYVEEAIDVCTVAVAWLAALARLE